MMKRAVFAVFCLALGGPVVAAAAADPVQEYKPPNDFVAPIYLYSAPHPYFVERPFAESEWLTDFGFGLLDKTGITGGRGAIFTQRLGFEYGWEKKAGFNLALPLAGTISSGSDNYGPGNVALGFKGILLGGSRYQAALGLKQTLPTASARGAVGAFSRRFVEYVKHSVTTSPYLSAGARFGQFRLMADLGGDLMFFTDRNITFLGVAGVDRLESLLSYDAGVELLLVDHFSGMVEFGGFTTLSRSKTVNQTFAIPSFRYTDRDMSFGVGMEVPVTDFNDNTTFLLHADFRIFF